MKEYSSCHSPEITTRADISSIPFEKEAFNKLVNELRENTQDPYQDTTIQGVFGGGPKFPGSIFSARLKELLVGLAIASINPASQRGILNSAYVLPSHRRRGIAEQLVEARLNWFTSQGVCGAEVITTSTGAYELYKKMQSRFPFPIQITNHGGFYDRTI